MSKESEQKMREALQQRCRNAGSGGDNYWNSPTGMKQFKIEKEGMYTFDIMPYTTKLPNPNRVPIGSPLSDRPYYIHFKIGPNETTFMCPRSVRENCPVCEEYFRMIKDKTLPKEESKIYQPKMRQLFYIVDTKDRESGVQVMELSDYNFGKGLIERVTEAYEDEENESYWMFASLTKGLTVKANFTKETFAGTTFYHCVKPDLVVRKQQYPENFMDGYPSLDDLIVPASYDQALEYLNGSSHKEEVEEDQETPPFEIDNEQEEPEKEVELTPVERAEMRKKARLEAEKKVETGSNDCPSGHNWGTDAGSHDDCDRCAVYKECASAE